jgi:hypothetical protein
VKARVFLDAFAECFASVAMARKLPEARDGMRALAVRAISARHGEAHADNTGRMFDRMWAEAQNPGQR